MIRELEESDYDLGYLEMMSEMKGEKLVEKKKEDYRKRYEEMKERGIKIYVKEKGGVLEGSITMLLEEKYINNLGKVCHIEDLLVRTGKRGCGVGRELIEYVKEESKRLGCYKVILNCKEELKGYYEKYGFEKRNIEMSIYWN
jgi:glucosamine-phosphate N-acetyltransferase